MVSNVNLHLYTWDYALAASLGHTEVMTVLLARGLDGAGDPRVKIFLNHLVMMSAKSNSNPEILRMCDAMHTAHSKSPSDALAFMRKHIPGVVRERDRMLGEEAAATAAREEAELIRSYEREAQLQAERAKAELLAERAQAELLAELEAEEAAAGRGAGGGGDTASSSSSSSSRRKKKKKGGRGVHAGTSDAGAAGADTREHAPTPEPEPEPRHDIRGVPTEASGEESSSFIRMKRMMKDGTFPSQELVKAILAADPRLVETVLVGTGALDG